jgi:DHA1 family bicyclomycin/chloramphenicol resistance-like MFS transporter
VSARVLVVLGGLMVLGVFMTDLYLPALPDIADGLGGSDSATQVTLTGCLIGLSLGQLAVGTMSDTFGRRGLVLVGLVVFGLTSLACAVAPSLGVLDAARVVQGVAGGGGMVLARAIVSDEAAGLDAGRAYAVLGALTGVGPILAPTIGGALLLATDWRGVFVALAIATAPVLLAAWLWVPPMPAHHRRAGGVRETLHAFATLLRDPGFLGFALASGFAGGTLFAYISGSSFVLQDVFGLSPQLFAVVFAVNGASFMVAALASGRLLPRLGHHRLLAIGLVTQTVACVVLLIVVLAGAGLAAVLACFFLSMASIGFIMPNATALALAGRGALTGAASALFGLFGFSFGAVVAPVVGVAGASAVPLGVAMAALSCCALLSYARLRARVAVGHTG